MKTLAQLVEENTKLESILTDFERLIVEVEADLEKLKAELATPIQTIVSERVTEALAGQGTEKPIEVSSERLKPMNNDKLPVEQRIVSLKKQIKDL